MKKSKKYSELRRVLAKQANSQRFLSPTGGPTRLSNLLYLTGPKIQNGKISPPSPGPTRLSSHRPLLGVAPPRPRSPIPSVNRHVIWGDFELPAACSGGNRQAAG